MAAASRRLLMTKIRYQNRNCIGQTPKADYRVLYP